MHSKLFSQVVACPVCRDFGWIAESERQVCKRCSYEAGMDGSHICLMPNNLSENNAREMTAYCSDRPGQAEALLNYSIQKPWNYPAFVRDAYLQQAETIRQMADGLGPDATILFVFGGGGMEAHTSGLLGPNTVIADISRELLNYAEKRFDYYGVAQPAAFIQCDAERLPFRTGSFDLVIGFEGVHHCMVPQAALQEIWRVSRSRTYVVDNFECAFTNMLERFGLSSRIEDSGVRPNRFSYVALKTMLFNAKIDRYEFHPRASLPESATSRLGAVASKAVSKVMEAACQTNMFTLATYRD